MQELDQIFEHRKKSIYKAKALVDLEVLWTIKNLNIVNLCSDLPIMFNPNLFKDTYHQWILSNKLFPIVGLNNFRYRYITNGITEAFTDFYDRPVLYVFENEYNYHKELGQRTVKSIEEVPNYSRLVVSYPFSGTGNVREDWNDIIDYCNKMHIEIFIDCCFFGISKVDRLNLNHDCITHVAFSLSKTFATGGIRTGVLYKRHKTTTPVTIANDHHYVQLAGCHLHYHLINNIKPEFIYNKYRDKQISLCKELNMIPSDTVIFGIDENKGRQCISYGLQEFDKPYDMSMI